jgi:1,4-alpha-glucan branching enzyme
MLFPSTVHRPPSTISAVQTADTVFVHFSLSAPTAHAVSLAGSFNGWQPAQLQLRRATDGTWEATIPLPVGEHRYQFVVDGQRWVPDPAATQADDGFGGTNSVIVVGPKGVVRS